MYVASRAVDSSAWKYVRTSGGDQLSSTSTLSTSVSLIRRIGARYRLRAQFAGDAANLADKAPGTYLRFTD